jgi:hypothetical protein
MDATDPKTIIYPDRVLVAVTNTCSNDIGHQWSILFINFGHRLKYRLPSLATMCATTAHMPTRPIELAKIPSKAKDADESQIIPVSILENNRSAVVDNLPDGGFEGWLIVFACSTITWVSS